MLTYAALLVIFIIFLLKWLRRKPTILNGNPIPEHPGLPIFGMALEIDESNSIYKLEEFAKQYGEIFSLNMCGTTMVVLNSESILRKAFCSEKYSKYFNNKPKSFYGKHFRPSGDSVAFIPDGQGIMYKTLKKTYIKALHAYGTGIKQIENNVLKELENVLNKIDNMETKEFEFVGFLKRSLTNIVSQILVGESIPDGDPDENLFWQKSDMADFFISHFVESVMSTFPILRFLPITKFGQMYRFAQSIDRKIAGKFFHSVKKVHQQGGEEGIINSYLELQRKQKINGSEVFWTDERIISQLLETIDAGILSTWSLMTNSMLALVNHPECQIKLQQEVDRVIGQSRMPTFSDRADCPYLIAFEKEILRYIPVAPFLLPHACREDVVFEGFNVKKDSMVLANIWYIHHDEKLWGDPWNFRPERFLDEDGALLPPEHIYCRSVLPFGVGERRCVGDTFAKTRYFLYMTTLLQRYSFETPEGCKQRSCDPRSKEDFDIKLTMRAKPFMVRAVERK